MTNSDTDRVVHFRLKADEYAIVAAIAEEQDRAVQYVLRAAIRAWLAHQPKGSQG